MVKTETNVIEKIPIKISEGEVLRYLGYQKKLSLNDSSHLHKVLKEELEQAYPLLESKGIYCFLTMISISQNGVIRTGQDYQFSVNKKIINLIQNAEYLLFAVATVGAKIEEHTREWFKEGQYLKAMVWDALGTVAVKTAGQWLNHFIEKENIPRGFQLSRYFEPGSDDWDIQEQKKVFTILQPEKIGVTLNSSCMMEPAKSLSWIRGMGQNLTHSCRDEFSCDYCALPNCAFRKK